MKVRPTSETCCYVGAWGDASGSGASPGAGLLQGFLGYSFPQLMGQLPVPHRWGPSGGGAPDEQPNGGR